ncbi:MAG: hypothetical protein L3J58_05905 [Emcibacter sp.]|nr:hypothetical protein [Emcibacter sp.]
MVLFLMGTGPDVVAAPQGKAAKSQGIDIKVISKYIAQERRQPVENSLIKPAVRANPLRNKIYRQDKAREAMRSGHIVSLSVIRKQVRQSFPGKIIDVRLLEPKNKNLPYIYRVKVLRKDGKLLMLNLNAATAKIVGVKGNR